MNRVTTYNLQSVFDIAIQEYGSIEGIFDLIERNPDADLEFDGVIPTGTQLEIGEVIDQKVVDYFKINKITPATGYGEVGGGGSS